MEKRKESDGAVVAAVVTKRVCLLVQEPQRNDPRWKFPSGTIEPKEPLYKALAREVEEETGFLIPHERRADGSYRLGNDTVEVQKIGFRRITNKAGVTHNQHLFVIFVHNEEDVLYLDGQQRKEDEEELIETRIFPLDQVEKMPGFLPDQQPHFQQVKQWLATKT